MFTELVAFSEYNHDVKCLLKNRVGLRVTHNNKPMIKERWLYGLDFNLVATFATEM